MSRNKNITIQQLPPCGTAGLGCGDDAGRVAVRRTRAGVAFAADLATDSMEL
jgi:hypothetical protein